MDKPSICPDCGSDEIRETRRVIGIYDEIIAFVCPVCDWASDPRIGRPPADRSKNFTLRRLMNDRERATDESEGS